MKTTVKSHDPEIKLPKVPSLELVFYHWSPTKNRPGILKRGLCPGVKSLQGDWKPPYVCFSDEPMLAWQLSGRMYPHIRSWDLWMCRTETQTSFEHFETILDTYIGGGHYAKEYRVYTRIFKRDLRYVATRLQFQ